MSLQLQHICTASIQRYDHLTAARPQGGRTRPLDRPVFSVASADQEHFFDPREIISLPDNEIALLGHTLTCYPGTSRPVSLPPRPRCQTEDWHWHLQEIMETSVRCASLQRLLDGMER